MIVPRYWAEARLQHKERSSERRRQITVRRYGWSNASHEEAQQMADYRAAEALQAILGGEKGIRHFEPKVPYNGAEGMPIREQIVAERGETLLTRNRYGALCLNTPNVAFIDIDRQERTPWLFRLLIVIAVYFTASVLLQEVAPFRRVLSLIGIIMLTLAFSGNVWRFITKLRGGRDRVLLTRVRKFFEQHPDLRASFYETPAGYRLLFTHALMDPTSEEVQHWFQQLEADPEYVKMCQRQKCFRARVSPKPWRIGVLPLHREMGVVWPLNDEQLGRQRSWVERYAPKAESFASCRFLESFGNGLSNPAAVAVRDWHDELSQAHSGLPIA